MKKSVIFFLCLVLFASLASACTNAKEIEKENLVKFWETLGEKLAGCSKITNEVVAIMTDVGSEKVSYEDGAKKIRDKAEEYSDKIGEIKKLKAPTSSTKEIQSDTIAILEKILTKGLGLWAEGLEKKDASLINKANANMKEAIKDIDKLNKKVGKELEKYKE